MSGPKHYRVRRPKKYTQKQQARVQQRKEQISNAQAEQLKELDIVKKTAEFVKKVAKSKEVYVPATLKTIEIEPSVLNKPTVDAFELSWKSFIEAAGKRFPSQTLEDRRQQFLELSKTSRDQNVVRSSAAAIERSLSEHLEKVNAVAIALSEVQVLAEALDNENAVTSFHASAKGQWRTRHDRLANTISSPDAAPDKALADAKDLVTEARTIIDEAIGREQDSEARYDLLQATIESLKSLGFVVSDPQYENLQNPLGPVVLSATRGPERVYISVPLAGEVQSQWNGIPDESCADGFLTYLDKLKEKGFECEPTRQDLQNRPRLIKKGEKALPRSSAEGRSV